MSLAASEEMPVNVYLTAYLDPLVPWLEDPAVSEILINRPGEVWVERAGQQTMSQHAVSGVTDKLIERLASQIARINSQAINREHPILAATLPTGERVQVIGPPATRSHWALAIRKQVLADVSLEDFAPQGGFRRVAIRSDGVIDNTTTTLRSQLESGDIGGFLRQAVAARKTMLISGGTSAGKTSLLNALIQEIPTTERLIAVEDTAEVRLDHPNSVGLIAVKGEMGQARVNVDNLLQASLRMRPDRLIVGEIRGVEAATFLRAINTGHPGSITTLHADSPSGALEQIALMVLQSGFRLSREDTIAYVKSIVDVIIQVSRKDGRRQIDQVVFDPKNPCTTQS